MQETKAPLDNPDPIISPRPKEHGGVNAERRVIEQFGVLEAMRWHWRLALLPVVLLIGAAIVVGMLRTPVYTATANLTVDFGAESPSSLPGSVTAAQALADSYSRAVQATPVVRGVACTARE